LYAAVLTASAIVAVAIVAGCGGGGTSTTTVTTGNSGLQERQALAITAYIRQANLLCKVSKEERERRLETTNSWVNPDTGVTPQLREKIVRYVVIAPTEQLSKKLQELGPVNGADKHLESFVGTLEEDAKRAKAKPLTAFRGTAFVKTDLLAKDLALDDCVI